MTGAQGVPRAGVSVVVCCHNSAGRLPPTLAHLAAQRVAAGVPWEAIVVDNASSDGTAEAARRLWPANAPVELRVVAEPKAGLSHARMRGFDESRYGTVLFVDDDNWLADDYVQVVSEIMSEHPEVGVCGGRSEAVCEVDPPEWFDLHKAWYAVGQQAAQAGDVTDTRRFVWGAGAAFRAEGIVSLRASGFRPLLTDRRGALLMSGGDNELCYALALAGWRVWYDPRLVLCHFIPAARLTWEYRLRIARGNGVAYYTLSPYLSALKGSPDPLNCSWLHLVAQELRYLASLWRQGAVSARRSGTADPRAIEVERRLGRLEWLLRGGPAELRNVRRELTTVRHRMARGRQEDALPNTH